MKNEQTMEYKPHTLKRKRRHKTYSVIIFIKFKNRQNEIHNAYKQLVNYKRSSFIKVRILVTYRGNTELRSGRNSQADSVVLSMLYFLTEEVVMWMFVYSYLLNYICFMYFSCKYVSQ